METTRLIVNADDFGLSQGVNRGIEEAVGHGIVTSASLMVRAAAATDAARIARRYPDLSVGLHLDLGEWIHERGTWVPAYEVVPLSDGQAVQAEVAAQLTRFERLLGCTPTHLDSHQHVHLFEPVRSVVERVHDRIGIPIRALDGRIRYVGDFYGQTGEGRPIEGAITVPALLALLEALSPGLTELSCHPGRDDALRSVYARERSLEVETLTDPRVCAHVARLRIELLSYSSLRTPARPTSAGTPRAGVPA